MTRNALITHLDGLGKFLTAGLHQEGSCVLIAPQRYAQLEETIRTEINRNGWFDEGSVRSALSGIAHWLKAEELKGFCSPYPFQSFNPSLALILAGNLPLVGFHDVLCGLLSGYRLQVKMSSEDKTLLPLLVEVLNDLDPRFSDLITLNPPRLAQYDAVIGTGSDSTLVHLSSYFKNKPHLLRGHRTSIAILEGRETPEALNGLAKDIFQYYGRGCRNVTHLLVPKGYSFDALFAAFYPYREIIQHKKYGNNYEYNRAIYLLSQQSITENGFILISESTDLHPPLAMLHYHEYEDMESVHAYIAQHRAHIQCIVGGSFLPFGKVQMPEIHDFADDVNTLSFLKNACN